MQRVSDPFAMHARVDAHPFGSLRRSCPAGSHGSAALQNTPEFQTSRRLRRKIEMLFGHMKKHFRFTRLKLRGLSGAAEEFLMMATVQNLRRLIRMRPPDVPMPCRAAII